MFWWCVDTTFLLYAKFTIISSESIERRTIKIAHAILINCFVGYNNYVSLVFIIEMRYATMENTESALGCFK